jgi:hypothetical protein
MSLPWWWPMALSTWVAIGACCVLALINVGVF